MKFHFERKELLELYSKAVGKGKYPESAYKAFFKRIELMRAAKDMRDLRAIKGAHFEKIKERPGIYSMRLDDQYRLELSFERDNAGETIARIERISKHYGD